MAKRIKEKPFNNGTMTETAFWGWMRGTLRNKSRHWKPIQEAKKLVRRKYTGTNPRVKWEYQCKSCRNWYMEKETAVDHIEPAGKLNTYDDLPGFIKRLFCEVDGLQVLCHECHTEKSMDERAEMARLRRNNKNVLK